MMSHWRRPAIGVALVVAGMSLAAVPGCDVAAPQTYEVRGKVVLAGGDVRQLAGGHVEAALADDRRVLASGEIREDGSFELGTVYAGKVLSGARKGEYQVRIVLSDEDSGSRRRKGRVVAPRFAQLKTSGLSFQVPGNSEVVLHVAQR